MNIEDFYSVNEKVFCNAAMLKNTVHIILQKKKDVMSTS